MFGWLNHLISGSPLSYLVIVGLAIADIVGVVPAETVIVTAVLLALHGSLLLVGVGAAAVAGSLVGDNILYVLGWRVGTPLVSKLFRGEKSRRRLGWARQQMERHGSSVIIVGRFVPMGRTAVVFAAGLLDVPWRRFIVADAISVALWSLYWVGLPVLLGETISGTPWYTVLISLGVAAIVGGIAELARRHAERRRQRQESDQAKQPTGDDRTDSH